MLVNVTITDGDTYSLTEHHRICHLGALMVHVGHDGKGDIIGGLMQLCHC